MRDESAVVELPEGELGCGALSEGGRQRLVRERAVLGVLRGRVSFGVPEVVRVAVDADRRRAVAGAILGQDELFAGLAREPSRSRTLGRGVGELIAELHGVDPSAISDVLPERVSWPEPTPWIRERLP